MHRPGAHPDDMQPSDFICDFSLKPWDGSSPMVEGHQGSLISGDCLARAYTDVVLGARSTAPPGSTCTMCLEQRDQNAWQSPANPEAIICERCIRQSATTLDKDPDWEWTKPTPPTAGSTPD